VGGKTWTRFLLVGLLVAGAGAIAGEPIVGIVLQLLGWVAVTVAFVKTRSWTWRQRLPWLFVEAAGALFLIAGLVRTVHAALSGVDDPFPSVADAFFICGYLALIIGEVLLVRFRTIEAEREHLIDAAIVASGVGLLAWAVLLAPYVRDDTIAGPERILDVVFASLTLVVLAVTARMAVGPGIRNPAYYLLAGSISLVFITDLLATLETAGAETRRLNLALTPFIFVLFTAAALHPSVRRLTEAPPDIDVKLTVARQILLAAALLVAPGVLVWQIGRGKEIDLPVVVTGSIVLSLLVLARLSALVRAKERTAERERVLHEAGAALVIATSRDEILDGTLTAVLALTRGVPEMRATVLLGDEVELEVAASAGAGSPDPPGTKLSTARMPAEMQAALRERRVARLASEPDRVGAPAASTLATAMMALVPLVSQNELRGAIVLSTAAPIPRAALQALAALSSEVALALESAALNESLLRRRSEARFRALIENSSDLVVVVGAGGLVTFTSPASNRLLGRSEQFFDAKNPLDYMHPDDRPLALDVLANLSEEGPQVEPIEVRLLHADGSYRWFEILTRDLRGVPDIGGIVVNAREITDRKGAEQLLARSEARFRALVQNSSDVVAVIDHNAFFTYVSPSITGMLGYKPDELVGTSALALLPAEEVTTMFHAHGELIAEAFEQASAEIRVRNRDGEWHTVDITITDLREEPAVAGIVLNARDVTVRKELESDLRKQALHDALTGLGNRAMFTGHVTNALGDEHDRHIVAVLFVDLDDFKTVNDSLGHDVGDALLILVADRLRACLRESDVAARLGGDEFAILLESAFSEDEVHRVAERVLASMREPYQIDEREMTVTASIGIAVSPDRTTSTEVLLRNADMAMYLAKDRGKDRSEMFEDEMHATAYERLQLRTDLAHGIEEEQLIVHYQPIVGLQSGRIHGVEALVRWQHPDRGLLSPDIFIPLAEETGLIVPIGRWVLGESCRQLAEWRRMFPEGTLRHMSVNLSVRQLQSEGIVDEVAALLVRHELDPKDLTLEITESMLMADTEITRRCLNGLRDLGVSLAVDDFGTGYSSLGYIKHLPVDTIKIDRTFVDGLGTEEGDEGVVRAVIALADGLNVKTVAEGIEGAVQLETLRALGCDLGQGYYFSRPVAADELAKLVRAGLAGEAFGWEQEHV